MYYTEKEMMSMIKETTNYLQQYIKNPLAIAIVAGSGLGKLADLLTEKTEVSYENIPHFLQSTVVGHAGKLIFGKLSGKDVVLMAGRVHYYEGHTMQKTTFPIRVFQALGIPNLLLTNAAGGMHTKFDGGAIMIITDHINLMGDSPLVGQNLAEFGTRFPSMLEAYTLTERQTLKNIAQEEGVLVYEGIYAGWKGPAYETAAEIRYIHNIGADAVGMSTVPEVLVASHGKTKVVAMSCITNMAAGLSQSNPNHEEVMEVANKLSDNMCLLTSKYVAQL
ncbi:MAG: purine-nucleoside phosphorylase [Culicoidibacterales bacterium]